MILKVENEQKELVGWEDIYGYFMIFHGYFIMIKFDKDHRPQLIITFIFTPFGSLFCGWKARQAYHCCLPGCFRLGRSAGSKRS